MVGQGKTKEGRQKGRMNKITFKSYSNQQATGSGHVSCLLCLDLHCTHYLGENVAVLLQAREEKQTSDKTWLTKKYHKTHRRSLACLLKPTQIQHRQCIDGWLL